jgi:hypothetical protein
MNDYKQQIILDHPTGKPSFFAIYNTLENQAQQWVFKYFLSLVKGDAMVADVAFRLIIVPFKKLAFPFKARHESILALFSNVGGCRKEKTKNAAPDNS